MFLEYKQLNNWIINKFLNQALVNSTISIDWMSSSKSSIILSSTQSADTSLLTKTKLNCNFSIPKANGRTWIDYSQFNPSLLTSLRIFSPNPLKSYPTSYPLMSITTLDLWLASFSAVFLSLRSFSSRALVSSSSSSSPKRSTSSSSFFSVFYSYFLAFFSEAPHKALAFSWKGDKFHHQAKRFGYWALSGVSVRSPKTLASSDPGRAYPDK